MTRKFEKLLGIMNETPLETIISLFQVKLNSHHPSFTFSLGHRMDQFLNNYCIIHTFPSWDKSRLKRRYYVR